MLSSFIFAVAAFASSGSEPGDQQRITKIDGVFDRSYTSLGELKGASSLIVLGTVTAQTVIDDKHGIPSTLSTLTIERILKGTVKPSQAVEVKQREVPGKMELDGNWLWARSTVRKGRTLKVHVLVRGRKFHLRKGKITRFWTQRSDSGARSPKAAGRCGVRDGLAIGLPSRCLSERISLQIRRSLAMVDQSRRNCFFSFISAWQSTLRVISDAEP